MVILTGFDKRSYPKLLTRYGKKKIEEKNICTCHIDILMRYGCQCGQFQREMKNALPK